MESRTNYSWIGKLMTGIMGLILALLGATIIQIQLGNITVIFSGHDIKVENGSQTQTVTQPPKPESRAPASSQPVSELTTYPVQTAPVEETTVTPATVAKTSTTRRATPVNYESDEECVCPADDDQDEEYEAEPAQYTRPVSVNNYVSNRAADISNNNSQAQAQSSVSIRGGNVSVQSSATGGQTRTRIVVNGRVVVDQ